MRSIPRDALGGLCLIAIGGFVAIYAAATLKLGSFQQIGPGAVPAVTGLILVLLGVAISAQGMRKEEMASLINVRPLIAILGSIAAFAWVIGWAGLIPAIVVQVVISVAAEEKPNWRRLVPMTVALIVLAVLVFQVALGLDLVLVAGMDW